MMSIKHFALFLLVFVMSVPLWAEDGWKTEAERRIEQCRKNDVALTVTKNGVAVADAKIQITMLEHEFRFGCNIFMWEKFPSPQENEIYKKRFAELFNFATLGFYWASYENKMDKPNYEYSQKVADWCKANRITPKGHPLAWNFSEPNWVRNISDEELYRRQMERTKACPKQFAETIGVWDVINEVTEYKQKQHAPRLTELMTQHGAVEFAKTSFTQARKGNPNATLLINDYVFDKRYADLIEKLIDADGKPLYDVIGIQSHFHSGVWNNKTIWETCERFAKFGVPLHFTELTILSTRAKFDWNKQERSATTSDGEQWQADEAERIYTMLFSHPSVEAITWWDFSDRGAWMEQPAGLLRNDLSPKPAYERLQRLIKHDWATNTTLTTDSNGTAKFRAFRGTYQAEITFPDNSTTTQTFHVQKEKNEQQIIIP